MVQSQHIISPEPHLDHVDCTEETSLSQEGNKFSRPWPILSRGVVKNSTEDFKKLVEICLHFQKTSNKFISEPNLMVVNVKCNVEKDKLFHCLWECPRIMNLWKDVLDISSKIVSEKLPICPQICILGLFPKSLNIDKTKKKMITYSLLQAKHASAPFWKNLYKPNVNKQTHSNCPLVWEASSNTTESKKPPLPIFWWCFHQYIKKNTFCNNPFDAHPFGSFTIMY